jgi:hypothetical protein
VLRNMLGADPGSTIIMQKSHSSPPSTKVL